MHGSKIRTFAPPTRECRLKIVTIAWDNNIAMSGAKKKRKIDVIPTLFIVAGILSAGYMAYRLMRPSVFAQQLSAHATVQQLQDGDDLPINQDNTGQRLDVLQYYVPGKYTIFDFKSEHCPGCRSIAHWLVDLTKFRPDIAVRAVDVDRPGSSGIDWDSPLCKQYHIHLLPHFKVYGPEGKLLIEGKDAEDQIIKLINDVLVK